MPESANLVPSLEETVKKSKEKIDRFTNVDNSWNKEGIMKAFDEEEDSMVYCTVSDIPLFYETKDGKKMRLESCGYCFANGKPYHITHLVANDNMKNSKYPIEYIGLYSIEEAEKPLTQQELTEIRKNYGI